jgi:hypothetical protein
LLRRLRQVSLLVLVGVVVSAAPMARGAGAAAPTGGRAAKQPPSAWSDDPRSSAALNRLAAESAQPTRRSTKQDPRLRILPGPVNDLAPDTTDQDTQSETTIGVLGSNVVIGWNDSGSYTGANNHFTGYGHSADKGLSFTDQGALPDSTEGDAGDPVLAVDQTSELVYLSTLGFTTGESIQVFKSSDGGETFAAPVNGTPGYTGGATDFRTRSGSRSTTSPAPARATCTSAGRASPRASRTSCSPGRPTRAPPSGPAAAP